MCDVRKSVVRLVALGLAAGLLSSMMVQAKAQVGGSVTVNKKQKKQQDQQPHRETNASHQARIARTIAETYSHKWEVGGGGGFLRWNSGPTTQRNNEISWDAFGNRYLSPRLGIIASAQGSFGNAKANRPNTFDVYTPQINEYFFMGGANYRFYRQEKFALSVQGQGGVGWGIFSGGDKGIYPATLLGLWKDGFRPAFQAGVNADYNLYPNFAIRFTPTWTATTFAPGVNASGTVPSAKSFQSNFGFNAGFMYRFGKQSK